jgi:hypothetical protein
MRRYGLYDTTRGLTTAVAVGTAGLLLWLATHVGQQTTLRFWASMGIVAGAGLIVALAQAIGGWTKGLRMRLSPGTFVLCFVPTLIVAGWTLMATQPGTGWHEGRIVSWSSSIGVLGVVHDLGLWHGVLAFGLGLVLGLALDTVPAPAEVVAEERTPATVETEPVTAVAPSDRWAADEPLSAERDAARTAEPRTAVVGPHDEADTTKTRS